MSSEASGSSTRTVVPLASLAFWREVGATRYVREGEELLAASA